MIVLFFLFFVLIAIGFPIAIAIGLSAIVSLKYYGYPLIVIAQKMVTDIDSFTFIAIPLFILAGELMNVGKITDKIFNFAKAIVGWIPGGLAHANVVASVIFAGMSGSAIADAGGLGVVEMKAMRDAGFNDEFSSAVTAASSTIGPIFPARFPCDLRRNCECFCRKTVFGRSDSGSCYDGRLNDHDLLLCPE